MPTIRKRNGKWQVQVRLKGHAPVSDTFPEGTTRDAARAWGLEREREFKLSNTPTEQVKILKGHTLGKMIATFQKDREEYPHKRKRSYANEKVALDAFLRREAAGLCLKTLADIKANDFAGYRDRRLKSGIKGSTLRRELNPIRNIFKVAKREWGWPVHSPFSDLDLPKEPPHRERVASFEEMGRLSSAAQACRGVKQVRLWRSLILTALNLGMRRGELLKIEWRDIDFDRRTLNIRAEITKTGKSRLLPLCKGLNFRLWYYGRSVFEEDRAAGKKVFPLTGSAHEQAWRRICKRANLKNLTFHDLRHTAASIFDSRNGLTVSENNYMLGHDEGTTNSRYRHAEIERIRAKLDVGFENIELPETSEELGQILEGMKQAGIYV